MIKIADPTRKILTNRRGAIAIVVALSMVVLLGFGAFAIDFGNAYVVKNELQNAADAAALAGASVLFHADELCVANDMPYDCCTANKTGTCNPGEIDTNNVTQTATAVATKNYRSGATINSIIEVGHYAFASTKSQPGDFTPNPKLQNPTSTSVSQMEGWVTQTFSALNPNTNFINAVRVTLTRTNVPRFLSRIWNSDSLAVTVQAVAYIGFAGTLEPGVVDAPIVICRQSILADPTCQTNCEYSCVDGRMINSSSGNPTSNTAAWTNFTQDNDALNTTCKTANPSNVSSSCSSLNPKLIFGLPVGTVGGEQTPVRNSVEDCWLKKCNPSGPVSQPQDCTRPWRMTLPVIDCPDKNPGPCPESVLKGAVEVNLLWMWGSNPNMEKGPTNMEVRDPDTGNLVKSFSSADYTTCLSLAACSGGDKSGCRGICIWNAFVDKFGLKNANNVAPKVGNQANELKQNELAKTMFFLPDCKNKAPAGGTGGENYGILARYPVLVNAFVETPGE